MKWKMGQERGGALIKNCVVCVAQPKNPIGTKTGTGNVYSVDRDYFSSVYKHFNCNPKYSKLARITLFILISRL